MTVGDAQILTAEFESTLSLRIEGGPGVVEQLVEPLAYRVPARAVWITTHVLSPVRSSPNI